MQCEQYIQKLTQIFKEEFSNAKELGKEQIAEELEFHIKWFRFLLQVTDCQRSDSWAASDLLRILRVNPSNKHFSQALKIILKWTEGHLMRDFNVRTQDDPKSSQVKGSESVIS